GRTALGLVCTVLPFMVVGPLIGPVIDRIRGGRRAIVALSAVGRVIACAWMAAVIHSLWLFPAAFTSLVCSKTYLVAKASLVPSAVDTDDDLVDANAKLAVGSSVVTALAAVLGAGIYRVLGSGVLLHLNMVLLAVCAVVAVRLRPSREERLPPWPFSTRWSTQAPWTAPPAGQPSQPLAPELTEAGRSRRGRPWSTTQSARSRPAVARRAPRPLPPGGLMLAAVTMTSMRAVAGLMTALVIFAFKRDHAPIIWYGLVGVSSVGGNLGGATLAPFVRNRAREERIVPVGAILIGLAAVGATQYQAVHDRVAALALAAVVGLGASVAKTAFDALVQRDPPEVARARLFARFETVFQLGWVLAALVPTLLSLSLATGFDLVAVLCLGASVVFMVGWRRAKQQRLPSWWPLMTTHPPQPAGAAVARPAVVGPLGSAPVPGPPEP
ncbi:MAG: MFS transporter, partial [Acidimicrobiales bacterium]